MHGCRGAGEAVCLRLHIQRCVDAGGRLTEGTCGATVLPLVLALPSCANTASPIPVKPPACSTDPSCALQRARGRAGGRQALFPRPSGRLPSSVHTPLEVELWTVIFSRDFMPLLCECLFTMLHSSQSQQGRELPRQAVESITTQ